MNTTLTALEIIVSAMMAIVSVTFLISLGYIIGHFAAKYW